MDRSQIIALYTQDQRIDVVYPDMRREVLPNVVRHIDTSEFGEGAIIYSQLDQTNVETVIRAQMIYFESIGQAFEWKVYDYDQPPELKDRLRSNGFTIEDAEVIMVLDLANASAIVQQPIRHDVQRITDPKKLIDVQTVEQQVWDDDTSGVIQYLRQTLIHSPERMSIYVAYVDDHPASAAWIYFPEHSQFASLWGGATLDDFRQQGLYTALLTVRVKEAQARQVRYLTVDASPMSRPILEKFGFEMIAQAHPCKWSPLIQD